MKVKQSKRFQTRSYLRCLQTISACSVCIFYTGLAIKKDYLETLPCLKPEKCRVHMIAGIRRRTMSINNLRSRTTGFELDGLRQKPALTSFGRTAKRPRNCNHERKYHFGYHCIEYHQQDKEHFSAATEHTLDPLIDKKSNDTYCVSLCCGIWPGTGQRR